MSNDTTAPVLPAEHGQVRALRWMKGMATALLAFAAVVYVLTFLVSGSGAGWVGFLRAGAEAGMVGGLADWFAVTALFRRPLGLPIPHTAIIPTRKDDIGRSLQDFVGTNFLSVRAVRDRIASAGVPARLGRWLTDPAHARRVTAEAATLAAAAVRLLRDEDVQSVLTGAIEQRLAGVSLGPRLGAVLEPLVRDGAHHRAVDLIVTRLTSWLRDDRQQIIDVIARQAPGWSPEFLDRRVATRVHTELLSVAEQVQGDSTHRLRQTLDHFLLRLAADLRTDPSTIARTDAFMAALLSRAEVRAAFADITGWARRALLELIEEPEGHLRAQVTDWITSFGQRLSQDPTLRNKLESWLSDAAGYAVSHYREEITTIIGDTVARWDGPETARRVELQVGRDLQFIRINGTVVGAVAGLTIHALSLLVS